MENKTGNFTIISGESIAFTSENIFFNSFSDIENTASEKISKIGDTNGHSFGNYKDLVLKNSDVKVKETLSLSFYHTWTSTNPKAINVGSDSIVVHETLIHKVFEDGKEIKNGANRFVTDYFAHIDDDGIFDGLVYSTYYYHDATNFKQLLKNDQFNPHKNILRKYAEDVAKYKKDNKRCSPVQIQANENRKDNERTSMILTSSTVLGTIISQIPNPYTKYGGQVIAGISKGLAAIITKSEHANEVAIMFKLEYEKKLL